VDPIINEPAGIQAIPVCDAGDTGLMGYEAASAGVIKDANLEGMFEEQQSAPFTIFTDGAFKTAIEEPGVRLFPHA